MQGDSWPGGMPFMTMRRYFNGVSGKMDSLRLNIELMGLDPSQVRNIQVFGVFDYHLKQKLKIEMQGLMHLNVDTPNGASRVVAAGSLTLE
jgi:hypothetical protein